MSDLTPPKPGTLQPLAARTGLSIPSATELHRELRQNVALAFALETVARAAFDDGEPDPELLEHFSYLAGRQRRDLEQLAHQVAELITAGRGRDQQ